MLLVMPENGELDEDESFTQAAAEVAQEMPSGDDFVSQFAISALESKFEGSHDASSDDDVLDLAHEGQSNPSSDNLS